MNVLDSDNFANRSFISWLDNQYEDAETWLAAYSLIYDFLENNPDWMENSWSEILLAASGGEAK